MGKDFGVTFLGLWWAEFHAEKEMGAKMVGLPGSAVAGGEADARWPSKIGLIIVSIRGIP